MESYFALVIGLIVVVILAMALAAYNNRADEPVPQPDRNQQKSSKNKKNDKKKQPKGQKQVEVEEEASGKKKKKKKPAQPAPAKFVWDGTVENEDESMIELLKGSATFVANQATNEIKKKVKAVTATVGQTAEKAKGKGSKKDDDEEFEYVLMKRKKVDDKAKTTKKAKDTAVTGDATAVEGAEAAVPDVTEKRGKKGKDNMFFKKGVFQSLRAAAQAEKDAKQAEEDEKASAREKRSGKKETAEEPEAKDDKKDKPVSRPKKTGDAAPVEGEEPRQQRPRREPREPREPREAPPPPPRPLGGTFEAASLDDMLSAISSHYGPKPKQNFAKLPPTVLFRLLRLLKVRDIIALSQVNHFLSKVSRDDKLWRNFCEKDFALKVQNNKNQQSKKKFKSIYREEYLKNKKPAAK